MVSCAERWEDMCVNKLHLESHHECDNAVEYTRTLLLSTKGSEEYLAFEHYLHLTHLYAICTDYIGICISNTCICTV